MVLGVWLLLDLLHKSSSAPCGSQKALAQAFGVDIVITPIRSLLTCDLNEDDAAILGQVSITQVAARGLFPLL